MDEKRKGEIAHALFKVTLSKQSIRLDGSQKRELGEIVKATGIPLAEIKEYMHKILSELVDILFS